MARTITSGNYVAREAASIPISGLPVTIAAWIAPTALSGEQGFVTITQNTSTGDYFRLGLTSTSAVFEGWDGAVNPFCTMTGPSAGVRGHYCGVAAGTGDWRIYYNGSRTSYTPSACNPDNLDRLTIGQLTRPTPVYIAAGIVDTVGIWNVALTDGEVSALAKGFHPRLIRPQSLVACYDLFGNDSPEPDTGNSGTYTLQVVNSPTKATHGPIIYPVGAHQ